MDDVVRDVEGYRVPFDLGLDVVRRRQISRPDVRELTGVAPFDGVLSASVREGF